MQSSPSVCSLCGKYAGVPFDECWYCGARPSWHHGRCCPRKEEVNELEEYEVVMCDDFSRAGAHAVANRSHDGQLGTTASSSATAWGDPMISSPGKQDKKCTVCGTYARVPFEECWWCAARPSWHHGRCCLEKKRYLRKNHDIDMLDGLLQAHQEKYAVAADSSAEKPEALLRSSCRPRHAS